MVVLLVVGLILGLMSVAQAQQESGFKVKAGYFMPGDQDVKDIFGSDFTFGASYLYAFLPYGIEFGAEYFSGEAGITVFPLTVKQEWRVVPVTATFLFFPSGGEEFSAYMGGGIGFYPVSYDFDMEILGVPFLGKPTNESVIGFHVQGGFTLGKNFFAEAKYSVANVENDIEVNAGGLTIVAGYRF